MISNGVMAHQWDVYDGMAAGWTGGDEENEVCKFQIWNQKPTNELLIFQKGEREKDSL